MGKLLYVALLEIILAKYVELFYYICEISPPIIFETSFLNLSSQNELFVRYKLCCYLVVRKVISFTSKVCFMDYAKSQYKTQKGGGTMMMQLLDNNN